MDKIYYEINNININRIDNNNNTSTVNNETITNCCNQCYNLIPNQEKENNLICESNCKCEKCIQSNPENNFQNYETVSFKNPDQVDIMIEHDKKQACCVIYNNNCCIF